MPTSALRRESRHCLETAGVHVVEVPVDYSGNAKLLDNELVCPA